MKQGAKSKVFLLAFLSAIIGFILMQLPHAKVLSSAITGYQVELELSLSTLNPAASLALGAYLVATFLFLIAGKKLALTSTILMIMLAVSEIMSSAYLLLSAKEAVKSAVASETGLLGQNLTVQILPVAYLSLLCAGLILISSLWAFKVALSAKQSGNLKYERYKKEESELKHAELDPVKQWDALSRGEDPS